MGRLAQRWQGRRPPIYADQSQELQLLRGAERFRAIASIAWDERSIYPKSEYIPGSPQGQCGVTNFGFGLWLSRLSLVESEQLFFEEGIIIDDAMTVVGDDHTWLRIRNVDDGCTHNDLTLRFDLTADQFPAIDAPVVVQFDDYFYPDQRTSSADRVYWASRVTPWADYDIARFGGRLEHFMASVAMAERSLDRA